MLRATTVVITVYRPRKRHAAAANWKAGPVCYGSHDPVVDDDLALKHSQTYVKHVIIQRYVRLPEDI